MHENRILNQHIYHIQLEKILYQKKYNINEWIFY